MTNKYIIDFYNHYDEESRLSSKHGSVEFLTTMHYINKYLSKGDKIIEIGAGTGRYSHALAMQGYSVDAVELVKHNINIFKAKIVPEENISITQGSALDLSALQSDIYDMTLMLGPMYHLYNDNDKRRALSEAIRVTKPGGIVIAAYVISDGCLIDDGFYRENIDIDYYIKSGLIDGETFAASSEPKDLFELVRKEDIDKLMSSFDVTRLHYASSDGCALLMRERLDKMDDNMFDLYLKYHLSVCERSDMVGFTSHSIDVFRKNQSITISSQNK